MGMWALAKSRILSFAKIWRYACEMNDKGIYIYIHIEREREKVNRTLIDYQ